MVYDCFKSFLFISSACVRDFLRLLIARVCVGGVIIGAIGLLGGELLCVVDVLAGGQGEVRGRDLSQRSGC